MSTAILRLLRPEVSLLTVPEKPSQARVRHDIAEHLEALANKLGPLPDVWVEHVEMANVFVADVTGPGSHAGAAKKPLNESSAVRFNHASEPPLLRLWQRLSSSRIETIKGLRASPPGAKNFLGAEATRRQRLVWPPLSLTLGLVRDFEVLSRKQLVGVLRVGVWVKVLVLGDVETLELHVLLRARGGTLNSSLPSGSGIWLGPRVETLCLYLEYLEKELGDPEKRRRGISI